jgi:Family of unknown function (DUF6011)
LNDSNVTDVRIRCGHCGNYHGSVAEVKNCVSRMTPQQAVAIEPKITERQLPFLRSLLDEREVPVDVADYLERIKAKGQTLEQVPKESAGRIIKLLLSQPKRPQGSWIPDSVPDGRYAFKRDSDGTIVFYRVTTKRDGSARFVQKVLGSPGDFRYVRIQADEAKAAIAKIAPDPAFASQLFGHAVGACGVCGSPLTDPESIRLGIGPVCAKKHDW